MNEYDLHHERMRNALARIAQARNVTLRQEKQHKHDAIAQNKAYKAMLVEVCDTLEDLGSI